MGSPGSEDATEDLRKTAGALEAQTLVEQEVLPADRAQVLNKMAKYQVPQRSGDIVMIQSEHTGAIDILSADLESTDLLGDHRKVSPPLMAPPCIWTFTKMKEFKSKLGKEKNSRLVVKRGEVVTIRVPTHPEGKRVCWEFATDDYDIGFGVYFDWTPVTSTDITVQVSDSSEDEDEDEEEEEEIEGGFHLACDTYQKLPVEPEDRTMGTMRKIWKDRRSSGTRAAHFGHSKAWNPSSGKKRPQRSPG
ncbi:protein TMED8 isoform X2 [Crocuta crocuta]